jgi:hypothetical protein
LTLRRDFIPFEAVRERVVLSSLPSPLLSFPLPPSSPTSPLKHFLAMSHPPPLPNRRIAPAAAPQKTLYQENQESIELQELSSKSFPPEADIANDPISLWSYTAAGLLLAIALPLLMFPRLVFFLLGGLQGDGRSEVSGDGLTNLESFLCVQMGIL